MKREITFRAKEANTNYWQFGDLINGVHCKLIGFIKYGENLSNPFYHQEPIKESTICEFTGYRQMFTKTMIFEGDLVSNNAGLRDSFSGLVDKIVVRQIVLKDGKWIALKIAGQSNMPTEFDLHECVGLGYKVIGNVFDTPELCDGKIKPLSKYCVSGQVCQHKDSLEKGYPMCDECSKWLV